MLSKQDSLPQLGSPYWLELKLKKACDLVFETLFLVIKKIPYTFLFFVLGACLFLLSFREEIIEIYLNPNYQTLAHSGWVNIRIPMFLSALLIGPLIYFRRNQDEHINNIFYALLTYTLIFYIQSSNHITALFAGFVIVYFFMTTPLLIWTKGKLWKKMGLLIAITLALIFIHQYGIRSSLDNLRWLKEINLMPYLRAIIPLTWCLLELNAQGGDFSLRNKKLFSYLLSPTFFLALQPIKLSLWVKSADSLRSMLKGTIDITAAILAFYTCGIILKHFPHVSKTNDVLFHIAAGYRMYLAYFFTSYGIFKMSVGLGRWFGYGLPPATDYALLANNPIDSWKRWSTYLYEWMLIVIFIPTLRLTKSKAFAFLFSFFILYLLHQPSSLAFAAFKNQLYFRQSQWLINNLWFFLIEGVFVYFTHLTIQYWPKKESLWGWLSVLFTHFLLALAHIFVAF